MRILITHAVDILLLKTKLKFLTPARYISCMTVLISQPHISIQRCNILNPATLGEPNCCTELTDQLVLARPYLKDKPLEKGEVWFIDGSCYKDSAGKTITGYEVVSSDQIIEDRQLLNTHSAQVCRGKIALTRACLLEKRPIINCTNSC